MRNFTWCAEFIFVASYGFAGCAKLSFTQSSSCSSSWFRMLYEIFACYTKFSHRHAKLLHVGFLPLVFFLASLIGLATYCQAWKRAMKCSKTRILHVFELQLALTWIAQNSPSFFACFNDKKATKNTKTSQKLISNPC